MSSAAPTHARETRARAKHSTAPIVPPSSRIDALDGLRALCALAVVAYHMGVTWLPGGFMGVSVLFVLTGFLTTQSILRDLKRTGGKLSPLAFWKRRLLRLMPTAIVFVIVCGALCTLFNHVMLTKMRPDVVPALFMFINWTKIAAQESYFAAAGSPSPLTHFWSLALEAQFYLVWPLLIMLLAKLGLSRRATRRTLAVMGVASAILMAVMYVPGADPTRVYYGTDTRLFSMFFGGWLAFGLPMRRVSSAELQARAMHANPTLVGLVCAAVVGVSFFVLRGDSPLTYWGGMAIASAAATVLVGVISCTDSPLARPLSWRPLTWLGERSYALYVWHYPLVEFLNPRTSTTPKPWWMWFVQLAVYIGVAALSYFFVEKALSGGFRARTDAPSARPGTRAHTSQRAHRRNAINTRQAPSAGVASSLNPRTLPALAVSAVCLVIAVFGFIFVPSVNAVGDHEGDARVMEATLRKPLTDGVYDVVLIGDSVSLSAADDFNEAFPYGLIDSKISRQPQAAMEVLQGYLDQGVVGDNVVISIGTNSHLYREGIDEFHNMVGDRQLWFITLRSPEIDDIGSNEEMFNAAKEYNNVHVIDWFTASEGHDEYMEPDGTHINAEGCKAFVDLIVSTMNYEVPNRENTTYDAVMMGNGVTISCLDSLAQAWPGAALDCAGGRSPQMVIDAINGYVKDGTLGGPVIVALDAAAPTSKDDMARMADVASGHDLYLVNVRAPFGWVQQTNDDAAALANERGNVHVVDWYGASAGHDDYLADDGIQLTDAGRAAYVRTLTSSVSI